jgi:alkanesulfonate monooxygenase SsuD/methylene tetrahydromethanopterin reductase-like flavin-dependent oxidoreductase (luciferase family)
VKAFAREAGRNPERLRSTNQLAIYVGRSREETTADMRQWLQTEWDTAAWSESTIEHAVHGSPAECVEQLRAHVRTGVDRLILIPYRYRPEQLERVATEVLPKL